MVFIHYRNDEIAALAAPSLTPAAEAALRLQLMSRTSQWRAARAWWAGAEKEGTSAARFEDLLRPYLTLLLTSARDPIATAVPTSLAELTAAISANLTPQTATDLRVSLPLAQHLLRMASNVEKFPEPLWQQLVSKVNETTTRSWQEGVAAQAAKLRDDKDCAPEARQRFDSLIRAFGAAH